MCIAILNKPKTPLTKKVLRTCWDNNYHGAGMMYVDKGELKVFKELKDFNIFYAEYIKQREKHKSSYFVLHFRISTHGRINETNCHPFLVTPFQGFVHNGIIYNAPKSDEFSDTYMFNKVILQEMPDTWENNSVMCELIQHYIGSGSKLVILNADNSWKIINEKAGVWDNGNWFSNSTYKESKYVNYGGRWYDKDDFKSGFYYHNSKGSPSQSVIQFDKHKKHEKLVSNCSFCNQPFSPYVYSLKNYCCNDCKSDLTAREFIID